MGIDPIQPSEKSNNYDFDNDQIYDTKTGNAVAEMSSEEVLNKILKENEDKEKLREELHNYIKKFGLDDARTIAKSQELDKHIAKIQKIIWRNKSCVK